MTEQSESAGVQQLIQAQGKLSVASSGLSDWDHLHNLALQVLHSLMHQHRWTSVEVHTHSPVAPYSKLVRPMLSGMPPHRLYIHPDEQIEHLKRHHEQKNRRLEPASHGSGITVDERTIGELPPVREWILPTHIRERWSLRKMASTFDSICVVPPEPNTKDKTLAVDDTETEPWSTGDKWRQTKRLLLATLDDDSTVVYYIVHDGIVKPRQN